MKQSKCVYWIAVCIGLLIMPFSASAYELVTEDGCLDCHSPPVGDDLHGIHSALIDLEAMTGCDNCHTGDPAEGTVAPTACIVCHPADDPGKCPLVAEHEARDAGCTACHTDCASEPEPCPVTTIYGDDSDEAALLRAYRDTTLSSSAQGRRLIGLYYKLSPMLTSAMESNATLRAIIKAQIDAFITILK